MQKLALFFLLAATPAFCQDAQPDRVTVPFSDPARPKSLHASLINGGITVKGYDGKDAIVEARPQSDSGRRSRRPKDRTACAGSISAAPGWWSRNPTT